MMGWEGQKLEEYGHTQSTGCIQMLYTCLDHSNTQNPCHQICVWQLLYGCPFSVFQRAAGQG